MNEHYEKLERMYLNAKVNTELFPGTTIKISEGAAEIGITINDKFFHALNAVHGSVYFKLLDDAAFFAVNSVVTDFFVLTSSFNIQLLRPVNSGIISAKGVLRFKSQNLFVAEAILTDDKNREIAFGTGNFMKSKIALSAEIGYL